ncbi:MAG: DNA gyrase subunit A, partial [Bdellovibrionales bacterium]|nr:DNA gyrase subunit A [Bdellovibrionales bacterium]
NLGRIYWKKVYELPEAGRTARGRALVNMLQMKPDESITAILPVREFEDDKFVVMATKRGIIKKVPLMEFSRTRRSGIVACTLKENDTLIGVDISSGQDDVLLSTREGMAIRFAEDQVRAMGRSAAGVRGIGLGSGDQVVGMAVVRKSDEAGAEDKALLTVCENGYGKRTSLSDYRTQNRGGKGLIDIKADDRNGPVVSVSVITESSELMLITTSGMVIRFRAKDVSIIGRNTKGVRLINLGDGEKVVAVAQIRDSNDE